MSFGQGIWNALHVIMDFVFLTHELSVHAKRHRYTILSVCVVFLLSIFILGHFIIPRVPAILDSIEPFVIGGILGCVLSHLYYHLRSSFKLLEGREHWH